jgi:GWxTD domain-containing protein
MLAWALSVRDRSMPPIPNLDWTRLGRQADSALRLAAELDPANAHYRVMAGRFLLSSGVAITRAASQSMFERGLEAARTGENKFAHSEAAVELGRVYWRRYDTFSNRWLPIPGAPGCDLGTGIFNPAIVSAARDARGVVPSQGARVVRQELEQCLQELTDGFSGETDYFAAENHFREAFQVMPSNRRAYRQLAMLLVERNRWIELVGVARERLDAAPWDGWAWLTLGLAQHRTGVNGRVVASTFDSAMTNLGDDEVKRFHHLERVIGPRDTGWVADLDAASRFAVNRNYWLDATPLWSRSDKLPQLEFISRVAYAELRWTVDELGVRGTDTDRGDVYIRYGPPDLIASRTAGSTVTTTWGYNMGLVFTFEGQATFATARISLDDREVFDEIIQIAPVRWGNIREFTVDSMDTRVARFRGGRDSVDVIVSARPPVDAIRQSAEVDGAVRGDFWILRGGAVVIVRDSVRSLASGVQSFIHRVAPGSYLYRVEASAEAASRGARAAAGIGAHANPETGFANRGFGMSDVLLATSAESRSPVPGRWRELDVVPLVGAADSAADLSLVWENYELGSDNGTARYTVTVTMERLQSAAGRVAARITGALAARVGVDRTDSRVALVFDREQPHAAAILEHITMSLGDTPSGTYQLTVEITDHISLRTMARTTALVVRR